MIQLGIALAFITSMAVADDVQVTPHKKLGLEFVAGGLQQPVFVISDPTDAKLLFIIEKPGRIRIVKDGQLLPEPFLDISGRVASNGEQGLLSMAFHPKYHKNRRFFVNYTDKNGNTTVSRFFAMKKNPLKAYANREAVVLKIDQPFATHNGGQLQIGPDGYLYIGMGDGGSGGDPRGNGQNLSTLLGKMLRIDIRKLPYKIPPDNPFVNSLELPENARPEIWAYGLRNPWRFSFDRETGDLYIADVGQRTVEEIDFQPAADKGGENYGWNIMEGLKCYKPLQDCDKTGITLPVHQYFHSDGVSVTGGYVYRGKEIRRLQGYYIFADLLGRIWTFRIENGKKKSFKELTNKLLPPDGKKMVITSFGEDADGELYICDFRTSSVYKIIAK